jgi:hypothetical protein
MVDMEEYKKQNKRTASADPLKTYLESTQGFFDMWMNSYQTFGKLQVPALGPIREKQEKIMKGFPIYANFYNTLVESNINFQTIFTGAMKKTYEKLIIDAKNGITATKYKDFYNVWLDIYSDMLKEFMESSHYTSDMGKLMTNFVDFQKYNRDVIEENILKPSNLPTKTDIDEINKDLYTLRKTLKDLDKKTNEVSKILEEYRQKIDNIRSDEDLDISKKVEDLSKKIDDQKIDTKLELDKKITRLDLDKKLIEMSKKIKTEIQLDIDRKINDVSKKTKIEIQTILDNKISEISKKLDEQVS